jgi:hypothetical protein
LIAAVMAPICRNEWKPWPCFGKHVLSLNHLQAFFFEKKSTFARVEMTYACILVWLKIYGETKLDLAN